MSIKVGAYEVLEGLLYSKEHEWVKIEGDSVAVIGVSDYAVKQLHDIVYVTLPAPGRRVVQMEALATLESVKAVSDVYSPLSGEIIQVNSELKERPELVGESPYQDGWLAKLRVDPVKQNEERTKLLNPPEYAKYIGELMTKV